MLSAYDGAVTPDRNGWLTSCEVAVSDHPLAVDTSRDVVMTCFWSRGQGWPVCGGTEVPEIPRCGPVSWNPPP